ncbi:MAG: nitrite reductase small subunit NirD [bacterium]|nr:nitrite reductase small subunit NirD [bacterium]
MKKNHIIVIGNGMSSYKFCERMLEYDLEKKYTISIFGEEKYPAYDRTYISSYFVNNNLEELLLEKKSWYEKNGIDLCLDEKVRKINRSSKTITTTKHTEVSYDNLVICTGSSSYVPKIVNIDQKGVFVYRTIEDVQDIANYAKNIKSAAIIGGGLLGLEAANACRNLSLDTHIVEFSDRLMPNQLNADASYILVEKIKNMGFHVHLSKKTSKILGEGKVEGLLFADNESLNVDMVIISAGIRSNDELARNCDLGTGKSGGILVDSKLRTQDDSIYAIGEVAHCEMKSYGLVNPCYNMADILAANLCGDNKVFSNPDESTKLKLLGIDVASLGNPFIVSEGISNVVLNNPYNETYKQITIDKKNKKILGAILVGDVSDSDYSNVLRFIRSSKPFILSPEVLITKGLDKHTVSVDSMDDNEQICACNNISKGYICNAIRDKKLTTLSEVKCDTKAGTGCGACLSLVKNIFESEMDKAGVEIKKDICEHFVYSRVDLFNIIKVKKYQKFEEVLAAYGKGNGCEICKPTIASILASLWNDHVVNHDIIQDTNDKFMANIQRNGTYSVIPRVTGGEITPHQLATIVKVAEKYNLYSKITGAQRIALFGANLVDLPEIWEELIEAKFETGHGYGKSLRAVKSCVGTSWCRFGVQDSVTFAIEIENRYKGLRAPHKLKSAVSGCSRECAEAKAKDFGIIATETGWNLYICGNAGTNPRHAELLASSIDKDTCIKYLDRFLMFYIYTADKLQRTSSWFEQLSGGMNYLKEVIIDDKLEICSELEISMQRVIDNYKCEWKEVVLDPLKRKKFTHFLNSKEKDDNIQLVTQRDQIMPEAWPTEEEVEKKPNINLIDLPSKWIKICDVSDVEKNNARTVKYGNTQLAIFNFSDRDQWYATQNLCPHKQEMLLYRGMLGETRGKPKVACPMHKKTFFLETGKGLSDPDYAIQTFPVKVEEDAVYLNLPSEEDLEKHLTAKKCKCAK